MNGEEIGNPQQLRQTGMQLFQDGRRGEALKTFEAAAAAYGQVGDTAGQAEMFNNIGVIYRIDGKWTAANEALQRAQVTYAEMGDVQNEALVLGNLGDLCTAQGDHNQAAEFYGQAAEQFAAAGDRQKQAEVLRAYSLMRLRQREWFGAINLMTRSLEVRPRRNLGQQIFFWLLRLFNNLFAGG